MKNERKKNVYMLYINRNQGNGWETIGVASTKAIAKDMVKETYDNYIMVLEGLKKKTTDEEEIKAIDEQIAAQAPYNPDLWQVHPNNKRYCYYPLNENCSAYFLILTFGLNEMAITQRKPNIETLAAFLEGQATA